MNIVITGTSRGIGLELVNQAISRNDRVLAVARNPSPELKTIQARSSGRLEIAEVDVVDPEAGAKVAMALNAWPHVDVLINNAGVYQSGETVEDFETSFRVNTVAPLFISRAVYPKLRKAKLPKAIQITSLMGSIEDNTSGGSYAYRASKAALNMVTRSIAYDERWLIAAVVHPGWVQTKMGGAGAPTPVGESAAGIWKVIDKVGPADTGTFWDFEGDRLPW